MWAEDIKRVDIPENNTTHKDINTMFSDIQKALENIQDFSIGIENPNSITEQEKQIWTYNKQIWTIQKIMEKIDFNNTNIKTIKKSEIIWNEYKENNTWNETNLNSIKEKLTARENQITQIEQDYPELAKSPFVSDTHIRAFNEEKWEYVITAEDLKIQLSKWGVEWNSYLEIMRYLKWIEKTEWNKDLTRYLHEVLDYIINPDDYEENEYANEVEILKKHLPKNFLENGNLEKFAKEFNIKINEFNIQRAYEAENEDETNMWELELIIDNLIENLWEDRANELMQQCVKLWLNRDESILFLSQYSKTLKTKIKVYRINAINKKKEEATKTDNNNNSEHTEQDSEKNINLSESSNYIPSFWDNKNPIKGLTITDKEKALITNKEIEQNLINSFLTLKEVWLVNLWGIKDEIATAIWWISWSVLNIKDNFFDENELKIFLNSILLSVRKQKIDSSKNLDEFKNIFNSQNGYQIIWDGHKDNANKKWSTNIEEMFFEKYVNLKGIFQTEAFKKSLTENNK